MIEAFLIGVNSLLLLVIFYFVLSRKDYDYDDDFTTVRSRLDDVEKDLELINGKLTTILEELGYEVRPRF